MLPLVKTIVGRAKADPTPRLSTAAPARMNCFMAKTLVTMAVRVVGSIANSVDDLRLPTQSHMVFVAARGNRDRPHMICAGDASWRLPTCALSGAIRLLMLPGCSSSQRKRQQQSAPPSIRVENSPPRSSCAGCSLASQTMSRPGHVRGPGSKVRSGWKAAARNRSCHAIGADSRLSK